jgi:hypothetical protein
MRCNGTQRLCSTVTVSIQLPSVLLRKALEQEPDESTLLGASKLDPSKLRFNPREQHSQLAYT